MSPFVNFVEPVKFLRNVAECHAVWLSGKGGKCNLAFQALDLAVGDEEEITAAARRVEHPEQPQIAQGLAEFGQALARAFDPFSPTDARWWAQRRGGIPHLNRDFMWLLEAAQRSDLVSVDEETVFLLEPFDTFPL